MDRTYRMQRRTFLCAAFACPFSLFSLYPAWIVMAFFAFSLCMLPKGKRLWIRKAPPPYEKVLFSLSAALFFSALLPALLQVQQLHFATAALVRALSMLSALSLQCELLYRVHFIRRPQSILTALFLLLFIVCMQSAA